MWADAHTSASFTYICPGVARPCYLSADVDADLHPYCPAAQPDEYAFPYLAADGDSRTGDHGTPLRDVSVQLRV